MSLSRRLLLGAGAVTALGAGALGLGWWQVDGPGAAQPASPTRNLPRPLGEMDVTLTDHRGRRVDGFVTAAATSGPRATATGIAIGS